MDNKIKEDTTMARYDLRPIVEECLAKVPRGSTKTVSIPPGAPIGITVKLMQLLNTSVGEQQFYIIRVNDTLRVMRR